MRDDAFLQDIIEGAASALEEMHMAQRHAGEKPPPEIPEIEAVAEATRRDRDQLAVWPQQLRRPSHEQHVDVRLPLKSIAHRQGMCGIGPDFEIRRIHDGGVEFFHAIVIEQQPLCLPSLRCQDEIGVVDRITQFVPGRLQSGAAMPHVLFEQRQQRRVVLVENDLNLPGRTSVSIRSQTAAAKEPIPAPASNNRKRSGIRVKRLAMKLHTLGGVKTCPLSFRSSADVAASCRS